MTFIIVPPPTIYSMKQLIFIFFSCTYIAAANADNITFADNYVKTICVEHWDTNGDNELSEEEASSITSLTNIFTADTNITSFEELRYFTGVKKLLTSEFAECSNLYKLQLPPQLQTIGENAFRSCTNLQTIIIPQTVKEIGKYAFNGCVMLEEAQFHEGLTTIGTMAFVYCRSLQGLSIPASLTNISTGAFRGCSSLSIITVSPDNPVYDSREDCNAIIETQTNTLVLGTYTTSFPKSVKAIGNQAFYGNGKVEAIDIPEGYESVGMSAFANCTSLKTLTLPTTLTTINQGAFNGCSNLTDVQLSNGLMTIEPSAFEHCHSLKSISLPNTVSKLSSSAFYFCSSLVEVTVGFTTPLVITSTTFSNRKNATLYVPPGCLEAFKSADYWKEFSTIIEYFPKGDVNHDGSVNVLDVTLVIDYILDKNPENFHYEEANVNGDEYINVLDVTKIIDIILGK